MSLIKIATAIAATAGVLNAGIVNLPVDDYTKTILALLFAAVSTFFSTLVVEEKDA